MWDYSGGSLGGVMAMRPYICVFLRTALNKPDRKQTAF
jgi:hypothetical protein